MPDDLQVFYEASGRIARMTLNRPEKMNALSPKLLFDLCACLDKFESDETVRVGILSGAGRAFCVGFDLGSGSDAFRPKNISPWSDRERLRQWTEIFERIWNCPKPIIAQVHGYCMAGGIMLPLVADITLIADECVVGWPKLPMGGGFVAPMFARAVGPGRAKMMEFVAGSEISGTTAAQWGFAAEAVPAAELAERCTDLADKISKMSSELLHLKKSSINRVFDLSGFRETLAAGAEWDALAHEDPKVAKVRGWVRDEGMKGAIARFKRDGL
jgi:enoyl-CoA hydratase